VGVFCFFGLNTFFFLGFGIARVGLAGCGWLGRLIEAIWIWTETLCS